MSRNWFRLSLLLSLAFVLTLPGFAQRVHPPSKHHQRKVVAPVPLPAPTPAPEPQPQAPPAPPKPYELPAVPPQVSFTQGKLLIVAQNSTLADILNEVHKVTGATVDIASGDTSERVVGRIGPGLARDVLTNLLNGSKFNYVMVSTSTDATALDKVILTPKTITLTAAAAGPVQGMPAMGGSYTNSVVAPAPTGTTPNRALLQQLQPQVMPVQSQPPTTVDEDNNADNEDQDQQPGQPAAPQAQAPEGTPQPQNPATMQEQMIQELQRRYQDRINNMQKQNQPNQTTPPPQPPQPN